MIPIWQGMRVRVDKDNGKLQPTEPFEVQIFHVNRKAAKELIHKYEHFFKVSETMLKSITSEQFIELIKEVISETREESEVEAKAMEIMNDAPLDAFAMLAWVHNVNRLRWKSHYRTDCSPHEDFYLKTKRIVTKQIYLDNPDVFVPKTYAMGEPYPASDWGTRVLVKETVMEQYT